LLNFILGAPFWKGIASIATLGVVILTYLSLQKMRRDRKIQLNRELIDKVYKVLLQDLKIILNLCRIETLASIYPSNWKWIEIKEKEPYVAYQIPEKLYKKLNKFSEEVKNYEETLRTSFKEKFEDLLTKIVISKGILLKDTFEKVEDVMYFEGVGTNYKAISIYQLFFHSKSLKEFLEQNELKGKFLMYFFNSQGRNRKDITEEDFNKIFKVVNNRKYIFKFLSHEEFQQITGLYRNAKSLKKEVEKMILKLAKKYE